MLRAAALRVTSRPAARRALVCLALGLVQVQALSACRDKQGGKDAGPATADAAASGLVDASGSDAVAIADAGGLAPDAAVGDDAGPAEAAPARLERAIWRAVDNRVMAHRRVAGDLVIDAGDAGLGRFTRYGLPQERWRLAQWVDGAAAALAEPLAALAVPLDESQARAATAVMLRLHASEKTELWIEINGRKPRRKAIELSPGWQTIGQAIPPGWLHPGDNQLALTRKGRRRGGPEVALAWLRVGAGEEFSSPLPAARFTAARTLELAVGSSIAWYLTIPEGAHLVAPVAAPCRVEVRAQTSDGGFVGGRLGGDDQRVDLSSFAGKVVRMELTAASADTGPRCEVATLADPSITVHGSPPPSPPRGEPPRYVVLWVLDATRADRIPIFTPGAGTQTPTFEELAKTSAVFRQYYVQGNESQTSHSSVWTGVYPAVHNVRLAGSGGTYRLAKHLPLLAEQVAQAGLRPVGVTGNGFVSDGGGYDRGFAEYRNMMREKGVINGVLYGEKIASAALDRLEANRASPTYLFLGTVDSHSPWIARKPWIDLYSPEPYQGPFERYGDPVALGFRRGSMGCSKIPPAKDVQRLRAIYDSTISYSDDLIGKFIAQLKIWNLWDQTMLIITADHGEELFEQRRCGHGGSLRETLVRVPLLVHYPPRVPAAIVDEGAEGVDVLPTVLDALGAPPLPSAQGASLLPLAAGSLRGWAVPSYASQYEYAHAMRLGRWKLAVNLRGEEGVFDLRTDPGEQQNAVLQAPMERRMLADHLGLFLATRRRWHKATWGVVSNLTAAGAQALEAVRPPAAAAPAAGTP